MRSSGDDEATMPVPWAGGGPDQVKRPRWLESRPSPVTAHPPDGALGVGESVAPPSHDDPPVGQSTARLEAAIQAAMAAATPAPPGVTAPAAPTRDYEGELAAKDATIARLEEKLVQLATSAERTRRQVLETCEGDVVELAVAIAERIVGREVGGDPSLYARWVHDALTRLADQSDLVVLVSPDVLAAVPKSAWQDAAGRPLLPTIDPKLPAGSCEVRSTVSRIDGSAGARVRAVVEALGTSEEG
ncbi:MAG: hypothetical protein FJ096_12585 [Deltaproteobacteria bacterium]|nr:hypothetical protein [Deltaproteobacteria bacterium]